jgi:hypothetical protein
LDDRFGLVVGVVREQDAAQVRLGANRPKQVMAKRAESGGAVLRERRAERPLNLRPSRHRAGHTQGRAQLADEIGVPGAFRATRLVVEVHGVAPQVTARRGERQ